MSELIAAGTTQTAWVDVIVTSGSPKALFIKPNGIEAPAPSGVDFQIAHKGSAGNYHVIDVLNAGNINAKGALISPGTFGVRRMQSSVAAGMDVEG